MTVYRGFHRAANHLLCFGKGDIFIRGSQYKIPFRLFLYGISLCKRLALFNRSIDRLGTVRIFQRCAWRKIGNIIPLIPYLRIIAVSLPQKPNGAVRQLCQIGIAERLFPALDMKLVVQAHRLIFIYQ